MLQHLRRRRAHDTRGFTLIELLVVITILGILAAVVVFSVRGVTDKGQSASNQTDANILRTAEEAYRAQNGCYATSVAQLQGAQLLATKDANNMVQGLGSAPCTGPTTTGTTGASTFAVVCAESPTNPNACVGSGANVIVSGGTMVLAVGSPLPASNLPINPAATSSGTSHPLAEAMFNGLMGFDTSGNVVPDLAQAVPVLNGPGCSATPKVDCITNNGDGTQDVYMELRPGMVWQDNNLTTTFNPSGGPDPITNADVYFSFTQALLIGQGRTAGSMGPALGFSFTGSATAPTGESFSGGGAINLFSVGGQPLGVDFHFLYPYAPFLKQLNVTEAPIIPKSVYAPCALASAGGTGSTAGTLDSATGGVCPQNETPVGSGPFMFSSFTTSAITMVKNPQYFKSGLPYLSKLILVPNGSPAGALQSARATAGSVDSGSLAAAVLTTPFNFTTSSSYNVVAVPRGSGGGNCINTMSFNLWQPTNGTVGGTSVSALPEWSTLPGSNTTGDQASTINGKATNAAYDNPILSSALVRKAMFEGYNRAQATINDGGTPGGAAGTARMADSIYDSNLSVAYSAGTFPGSGSASSADIAQANADLTAAGWDGGLVSDSNGVMVRTWGNHGATDPTPLPQQTVLGLTPGTQLKLDINYNGGSEPAIVAQFISDMKVIGIDVFNRFPLPAGATSISGVVNNRNFEIADVSYCDGDDPVVGVQRQYVSSSIGGGFAANTTGYRGQSVSPGDNTMDGLWYQANRVTPGTTAQKNIYASIQTLALNPADPAAFSEIYVDETVSNRVTRSVCQGLNNQNTGLFVETAYCP